MNNFSLRSQIVTLNKSNNFRGIYINGLLKGDIGAKVNIQIINAFVERRKYIGNNNYEERIKIKKY